MLCLIVVIYILRPLLTYIIQKFRKSSGWTFKLLPATVNETEHIPKIKICKNYRPISLFPSTVTIFITTFFSNYGQAILFKVELI